MSNLSFDDIKLLMDKTTEETKLMTAKLFAYLLTIQETNRSLDEAIKKINSGEITPQDILNGRKL